LLDTHTFTLIVDRAIDEMMADDLFEAGLDDAGIGGVNGEPALDVDREAPTFLDAVVSAVRQVHSLGYLQVLRVDGDELVSQADIAERAGKSRQAVNHWIKRDGGSSGFPEPAFGAGTRSPLWRWGDVAVWLGEVDEVSERARTIGLINATLAARLNAHDEAELGAMSSLLVAS